jgi:hypothetical protein
VGKAIVNAATGEACVGVGQQACRLHKQRLSGDSAWRMARWLPVLVLLGIAASDQRPCAASCIPCKYPVFWGAVAAAVSLLMCQLGRALPVWST